MRERERERRRCGWKQNERHFRKKIKWKIFRETTNLGRPLAVVRRANLRTTPGAWYGAGPGATFVSARSRIGARMFGGSRPKLAWRRSRIRPRAGAVALVMS